MRRSSLAAIVAAPILLISGLASAATDPGELDESFGGDGKVLTGFGAVKVHEGTSVLTPEGKIVKAGVRDTRFVVARYRPNGTLDPTFSDDGKAATATLGDGQPSRPSVAVTQGGKVLVAGTLFPSSGNAHWVVARFLSNGDVDEKFGEEGVVYTAPGVEDRVDGVALTKFSKFFVYGTSIAGDDYYDFAVARYNFDGSLDTNKDSEPATHWDADGILTLNGSASSSDDDLHELKTLDDGTIHLGGHSRQSEQVEVVQLRLSAQGAVDLGFGEDGLLASPWGPQSEFLADVVFTEGAVYAVGRTGDPSVDFKIARYLTNGDPDGSFGTGGFKNVSMGTEDTATELTVASDGKVVVAGSVSEPVNAFFGVLRLRPNGTRDSSFGGDGEVLTEFPTGTDAPEIEVSSVHHQADGKILVTGTSATDVDDFAPAEDISLMALARYHSGTCGLLGTAGPDELDGTPAKDLICGEASADVLRGLDGNDVLMGGPGADTLRGGPGTDQCLGGAGEDTLIGCES